MTIKRDGLLSNPKDPTADYAQRSIEDEPPGRIRGMRALVEAIRAEPSDEFPMDRGDIDYSFGDVEVEDGRGHFIPVRRLTDHMKSDRFDSPEEVIRALREVINDLNKNISAA